MKRFAQLAALGVSMLAVEPSADGALPTEFRIFVAGENETEKGTYLFDDAAAAAVMAAYEAWGVDVMIDLEHQSLDDDPSPDPTARDARGWCQLELREDGSLWAVNVTWTEDGAARLRQKRQRYVSPAFAYEKDTGRVTQIVNVAITAIPATHGTPALVAASKRGGRARDLRKLSAGLAFFEISRLLQKALESRLLGSPSLCGPCLWVCDVFDASVVYELDGKLFEVSYTISGTTVTLGEQPTEVIRSYAPATTNAAPTAPSTPEPSQAAAAARAKNGPAAIAALSGAPMNTKQIAEAVDAIKNQDAAKALEILEAMLVSAAGGEAPPPEGGTEASANGDETKEEQAAALAVVRSAMALTGKPNAAAALAELERRSKVAVDLETREAALAADRAKIEATERRALVGELVKLGVEIPATAWSDDKGTVPVARLANEPIAELRDRVAKLGSAGGGTRRSTPRPPVATSGGGSGDSGSKDFVTPNGTVTLSARELRICEEQKTKPEDYAANKAVMAAARRR